MGIVKMGPPAEVLDKIRELGVKVFIETGTYKAQTSVWASKRFDIVYSVEASKKLYNEAVEKYGNIRNIKFMRGISKESLREIINEIDTQAVFWLDAHWSGGETFGSDEECPLIDELGLITKKRIKHYILIDDARLFMCPPPLPHNIDEWPDISQIIIHLTDTGYKIFIHEDVIIAVPKENGRDFAGFFQKIATQSWESVPKTFADGVKIAIRGLLNGRLL